MRTIRAICDAGCRYLHAARRRLSRAAVAQVEREHARVKTDADVGEFAARVVEQLQLQQQQ